MENHNLPEYNDTQNDQFNYLQKLSKSSNAFYNFILFVIIAAISSLPFIFVDVTVSTPASIQTHNLKESLYAPFSGKVTLLDIENNHRVKKGQKVVRVDDSNIRNELEITRNRKTVLEQNRYDIEALQNLTGQSTPIALHTAQYQTQYAHYIEQKSLLTTRLENSERAYKRYSNLFREKVISASEFEKYDLDYKQAKTDLSILETKSKSQWQNDKYILNQELSNLNVKENQLKEVIRKSVMLANVSGTGYKSEGIQVGTFVQSGQKVAEIIPDSNLIATCLVSPKDIGFIKEKQQVKLQIDAYNYYDWGMLEGSVFEIVKDVSILENKPYYIVHCKMNKTFLSLKNGYKGTIIKGMTARANFKLTRKSLWQLLFTHLNDWLNPSHN